MEEFRAAATEHAIVSRLKILGGMSEAYIGDASGVVRYFRMTYNGAGIFNPLAVLASGENPLSRAPPPSGPYFFSWRMLDMNNELLLDSAAFAGTNQDSAQQNYYFDNFDAGMALATNEWYTFEITNFQTIEPLRLWVAFQGEEYLFA